MHRRYHRCMVRLTLFKKIGLNVPGRKKFAITVEESSAENVKLQSLGEEIRTMGDFD
jgi:hypothetical protein